MSTKVEENGRRFVQVEVEVPGSPEEVWKAIATGPGISSWFVPTEVEEREGGKVVANFGPGMESVSTITQWDPPRSFTKDGEGMSPDAPPATTEWTVEEKSGGACVVRVVHSWFSSTDEWDAQWEMVEQGWKGFFAILRLVLGHFPGQPSTTFETSGLSTASESEAWTNLVAPLGLNDAPIGAQVRSISDAPAFAGKVEAVERGEENNVIVLLDEPAPGIAQIFAMPMDGSVYLSVRFYLFGESAAETASRIEPEWSRWLAERFPTGG